MTYAFIENDTIVEYPVYEGDIRLRYSNTSFPTPFVPPEGYAAVTDVEPPAVTYTQNLTEELPVKVDGVWTRNWVVTNASAEEISARTDAQWSVVRTDRNRKLADCDWTQLSDAPVDDLTWAVYRQELRDITTQTDPFNIAWPTQPGA